MTKRESTSSLQTFTQFDYDIIVFLSVHETDVDLYTTGRINTTASGLEKLKEFVF